ncbi:MAG: FGGY-family carbohydrate kinase [Spirochaetota bacterium]
MSLLGIDIGTTGVKAVVIGESGGSVFTGYREYRTVHPSPGYAELDAPAVWIIIKECIAEAASRAQHDPIRAISTSSLGEAVVPVTRDRRIVGRSILGADSRGGEYVERIRECMGVRERYEINPNIIGANYTLPKLMWLKEHARAEYERADLYLLWADAVGFLLGAEPYASNSLANRTLLFDIRKNDWSDELCTRSGIARDRFGKIIAGGETAGTVDRGIARELGLNDNVTIIAGGHDQCCNALGAGSITPNTISCGMGTYECITPVFTMPKDMDSMRKRNLNIEHHVVDGLYVSFIYNQAGLLVKWFRDTFAAGDAERYGASIYEKLNEEVPQAPTDLFTLPYFEMSGAPGFVTDAKGAIIGLRASTTRGEILRSIMESSTYYFAEVLDDMRHSGMELTRAVATGGGSRSDAWMQIHADVLGIPFVRPRITEASALGAAILAGMGSGVFASAKEAVAAAVSMEKEFLPNNEIGRCYRERVKRYTSLLPMVRDFLS